MRENYLKALLTTLTCGQADKLPGIKRLRQVLLFSWKWWHTTYERKGEEPGWGQAARLGRFDSEVQHTYLAGWSGKKNKKKTAFGYLSCPYRHQAFPSPLSLTPYWVSLADGGTMLYMCVYLCVFCALLRTIWGYCCAYLCMGECWQRNWEWFVLLKPPLPLCRPQSIILIPPTTAHVSEGTAFPETWHTVRGGVTSSDRIDNLPI